MDPLITVFGRDVAGVIHREVWRALVRDLNAEYWASMRWISEWPRSLVFQFNGAADLSEFHWRAHPPKDDYVIFRRGDIVSVLPENYY